jgi:hypothetical protein
MHNSTLTQCFKLYTYVTSPPDHLPHGDGEEHRWWAARFVSKKETAMRAIMIVAALAFVSAAPAAQAQAKIS